MKRMFWFVTGAAAGVGSQLWAKKKVKQQVDRFAPEHVQAEAVRRAKASGTRVRDAVADGREAMRNREAELRAERTHIAAPSYRPRA